MNSLPTRVDLLDPRPIREAEPKPIKGAVNIPLCELANRMHELPPKSETIRVAATGALAEKTQELLVLRNRMVEVVTRYEIAGEPQVGRLWEPNAFLLKALPDLKPGRALDLGCGTGRDAVTMAAYGWEIVAIDRLQDAIDRGKALARQYLPPEARTRIEWQCKDLSETDDIEGHFDLMTMFYYLNKPILQRASKHLSENGVVMIETFSAGHRERYGRPNSDDLVLKRNEMEEVLLDLHIMKAEELLVTDREVLRLLAGH